MDNNITHICIITQSHICRNPRALKEATLLAANNYKVTIITSSISAQLHEQDLSLIDAYPNINIKLVSRLSLTDRLLNKAGRFLTAKLGIQTALALGYGTYKYYNICKTVNANLYICHQELATYMGTLLIAVGYKAGFDLEDWYSEDLLPVARKARPEKLLKQIESTALNKSLFCLATSNAMAEKLSKVYLSEKPTVIYNVFQSRVDLLQQQKTFAWPLKLCWFSQTIGPGRGLEHFFSVINSFHNPLQIHLLGNISPAYKDKLKLFFPKQHQLFFHSIVATHQLAEKIADFDIGLALEPNTPLNKNYTISNKFFQYIQSGLPVIATKTTGQEEAFEKYKPGFMLSQQPTHHEIALLEKWLNNPAELQAAKERAIAASKEYNWENESKKLLAIIKNALEK